MFVDQGAGLSVPADEERLDARGLWMVPALVDIHMHIESSMTVPAEFSRLALPAGTGTVVADPHEIANVFGVEGIRHFMNAKTDLDIFYGLPSSVPSTDPSLETTGGVIGPEEIAALAEDPRVLCLGEVMNAHGLAEGGVTGKIIAAFKKARSGAPSALLIEGHCPRITGSALSAFIAAGVWADHTHQTPSSMREKIGKGMFIEVQRKSLTAENVRAIVDDALFEHIALVTDDVMPDDLVKGHLNLLVREAVRLGMRPEDAVYCATYTPSRRMMLHDRGAIAPGRIADFILLRDLAGFEIASVYKRGKRVEKGAFSGKAGAFPGNAGAFPSHFYTSVRRKPLMREHFVPPLPPEFQGGEIRCVTMGIEPHSTFTRRGSRVCPVRDGTLRWRDAGLCLIAVIERYGHEAPARFGFGEGMLTGTGALATSLAHDHHNLLVLGTCEADMALAANTVIARQGGLVAVRDGAIAAFVPLPVGGIVSEAPVETTAESLRVFRAVMEALGYRHQNGIMSLCTLSLLVSPELKISDKGLFDVSSRQPVPLYEAGALDEAGSGRDNGAE
jgi:adenine deaminase